MLPTRDPPQKKRPTQTETEGLEKIPRKWIEEKKSQGSKIDFKMKPIRRDTEGYFIIFRRRIHQEDINIVNYMHPI